VAALKGEGIRIRIGVRKRNVFKKKKIIIIIIKKDKNYSKRRLM
jgi:hypothetical protein